MCFGGPAGQGWVELAGMGPVVAVDSDKPRGSGCLFSSSGNSPLPFHRAQPSFLSGFLLLFPGGYSRDIGDRIGSQTPDCDPSPWH